MLVLSLASLLKWCSWHGVTWGIVFQMSVCHVSLCAFPTYSEYQQTKIPRDQRVTSVPPKLKQ